MTPATCFVHDPQPYDGEPLDGNYRIDPRGDAWVAWTLGMFPVHHVAYAERGLDEEDNVFHMIELLRE